MDRSLLRDYRDSFRYPEFWIYSTWLGIVTKYRQSRLGIFWAFFPPVLYACGVGGFYATLQGTSPREFIPHLGIGYVVFRLITVSLSESTTTCAAHASFIMDGRVRLTDYVLRVFAKSGFFFVLAIPVMLGTLLINPDTHWARLPLMLPALALVMANLAWMGATVAVLGARMTDVHELIGSILMFSFLFTPIIWQAEQVPAGTMRGTIARINPLFHMVEVIRAPVLGEKIETITLVYLCVMLPLGWVFAAWVYRRFARFVPVWI